MWKHGEIPVIGVIGGIGSGKSLVSKFFAEQGAFVLDADAVGHALLNQRPVREDVISRFGQKILAVGDESQEEPVIDRGALGAIVFNNPNALKDLESLVHPRMLRTFEKAIARVVRQGRSPAIVLDAAILLEVGWESLCDKVIFVDSPREQRLARVNAQRGWTPEVMAAREAAQWPVEKKKAKADAVVNNSDGIETLQDKLRVLWSWLISSATNPVPVEFRPSRQGHDPPAEAPQPA
ncbi:dephospho-CoA kinase [Singulisphaera sp. PoT]|uniref:dephospho-CoA kinase n=1 Tax=Singulisphaera sp. PoT TaxID=3411797 RepID=UPI003BF478CB